MCHFDTLDAATKEKLHSELTAYADAFGGKNPFLSFLEAIRKSRPHPLVAKHARADFPQGSIHWNKVVFQDKLDCLLATRTQEAKRENFFPPVEEKQYKTVLNLVRTMGPIRFVIEPKDSDARIELHAFDRIDEATTRLNPLFDAIFFCAVETVKKVLNYRPAS